MSNHLDRSRELRRYYENRSVEERMREFIEGAKYIVARDGLTDYCAPSPLSRLQEYMSSGLEIDRSLWDVDSLIVDIDLEYHNFDHPTLAWQNPERAFALQQPVLEATLWTLGQGGIQPLILVSGRGYHLLWSVARGSNAFRRLAAHGRVSPSLAARYEGRVDTDLGLAFAGIGMVLELVYQRVLAAAKPFCHLSIQPTAIEVGPGSHGREIISFDLSEYGDPFHTRHVRLPFSAYLKPLQFNLDNSLPIFQIPLEGMNPMPALVVARDPEAVLELSREVHTAIPDASGPMDSLLDEYDDSLLGVFHELFYRQLAAWPPALPPAGPPCLHWLLEYPNDLLLKPAALQHVVRVLTALDWRPGAIVQLIQACYSQDCDWGETWTRLDPYNRAAFYVRLFAGMIATGADELIDLNCVSHREKGFCMVPDCSSNLLTYQEMLSFKRLV